MTPQELPAIGLLLLKMVTLVGIMVYIVFAWVIVRQERLMAHVLEEGMEPVLRLMTYIHLVGSIAVFFLALIIL